jgi:hypothetical protein
LQDINFDLANIDSDGPYGVYHSIFDSFDYVKKITDPTFTTCKTVSLAIGLVSLRLASDAVIPYDLLTYLQVIKSELTTLDNSELKVYREKLDNNGKEKLNKSLSKLSEVSNEVYRNAISGIGKDISNLKSNSGTASQFRVVNDRLMSVERCFIDPRGLKDRNWYRHLIFAPGYYLGYGEQVFPGIRYALLEGALEDVLYEISRVELSLHCVSDNIRTSNSFN